MNSRRKAMDEQLEWPWPGAVPAAESALPITDLGAQVPGTREAGWPIPTRSVLCMACDIHPVAHLCYVCWSWIWVECTAWVRRNRPMCWACYTRHTIAHPSNTISTIASASTPMPSDKGKQMAVAMMPR